MEQAVLIERVEESLCDFTSLFPFRAIRHGQYSHLTRITGSCGGPSRGRHSHSVPDTGPSNADLPRCRAEGPSTSDTEHPDPTPRPEAGPRRPRAEGRQHGCYLPVAR